MDTSKQQKSTQGVSEPPGGIARFVVYGKPVPKERARTVTNITGRGQKITHSYTPEKTANQEFNIAMVYKSIYHGARFGEGVPLRLNVDCFMSIPDSTSKRDRTAMIAGEIRPTKKVLDVDNALKCVADALNGVAYHDDSQIVEMSVRKFYSEEPRTEIFLARITDEK